MYDGVLAATDADVMGNYSAFGCAIFSRWAKIITGCIIRHTTFFYLPALFGSFYGAEEFVVYLGVVPIPLIPA